MRDWLVLLTEPAIVLIDGIALLVIVFGTLQALVGCVRLLPDPEGHLRRDVWLRYARWLVAGLSFQLAADIIESAITEDWESIARLAAIALIRTFLNYFLERDLGRGARAPARGGASAMKEPPMGDASEEVPQRPARIPETAPPPVPVIEPPPTEPSTVLSLHRTRLSTHRTSLSEHRTTLSEHRTDLSTYRTTLSGRRTDMSIRRTGMSFQRTPMSADRTLMSVIRTSLSLISFGFTIGQVLEKLVGKDVVTGAHAPRNFGMALVGLGVLVLVIGIVYHVQFMLGLRHIRSEMVAEGLIHGQSKFPPSFTLLTALILLLIGLFAIASLVFHVGPFG